MLSRWFCLSKNVHYVTCRLLTRGNRKWFFVWNFIIWTKLEQDMSFSKIIEHLNKMELAWETGEKIMRLCVCFLQSKTKCGIMPSYGYWTCNIDREMLHLCQRKWGARIMTVLNYGSRKAVVWNLTSDIQIYHGNYWYKGVTFLYFYHLNRLHNWPQRAKDVSHGAEYLKGQSSSWIMRGKM